MAHDYGPPQEAFRFLLLGKTGSGKSSTGNTILGHSLFDADVSFMSVTDECQLKSASNNGATIDVMDSPGLFDTTKTHEEVSHLVMQAVASMHPGPDAIFYTIKIGRYTDEEFGVYNRLKALLDEHVTRYMILIFTHGDTLKNMDIDSVLSRCPQTLRQVLEECSQRYVVFDNTDKGRQTSPQVENLLQTVKKLRTKNGNKPYSCPKYAFVAEMMEEELQKRLQTVEAEELKNKQYVQELNQKLDEAELAVVREKEEFDRRDQERQEAMRQKEEAVKAQMQHLTEVLRQQQVSEAELRKQTEELRVRLEKEHEEFRRDIERQRQEQQEILRQKDEERVQMMQKMFEEREKANRAAEERHYKEMALLREQVARQGGGGGGNGCAIL